MITKNMIRKGLKQGVIEIVEGDSRWGTQGTVGMIDNIQFYFGGQTVNDMSPEDYLANTPLGDIVEEIYDALDYIAEFFEDEYKYFESVLSALEEE